ncbi:helix-turn-helix transcriptional regulator [Diplocloster hominis]|uniref:helix-turn-helix domain-containing protein n=1 Tax=Diplocloster hominis TaxID=3079010 RepID=UPI0031BA744F
MEFHEKLQELRKQKGLTQEELSAALFVSRTAISKWESGRGYPSIDSLKSISEFFSITIDELLSNRELICIAETDNIKKTRHMRDFVFGLLDCAAGMMFLIPLFGQQEGDSIRQVSLLAFTQGQGFIKEAYFTIVLLTIIWGVTTLALQNYNGQIWVKISSLTSVLLSIFGVLIFIASRQAYAAFFVFILLIIKGILLLKRP